MTLATIEFQTIYTTKNGRALSLTLDDIAAVLRRVNLPEELVIYIEATGRQITSGDEIAIVHKDQAIQLTICQDLPAVETTR